MRKTNKGIKVRTMDKEIFDLTNLLIDLNKYSLALNYLKELIIYNPSNYYIRFNLAKIYLQEEVTEQIGKDMLIDLIKTDYVSHALIELINVEMKNAEIDKTKEYINQLMNTQYKGIAHLNLAKLSFLERDFDSAKRQLKELLKHDNHMKLLALESMIYTLIREEKYSNALQSYYEFMKLKEQLHSTYILEGNVSKLLNYKLNLPYTKTYFIQQLEEYNELQALEHIYKHLDVNDKKRIHNVFYSTINIDNLYNKVKYSISNMNPYEISISDKYFVKTDEMVGEIFGIKTNKVKVITLPNTKKIISMYPSNYMRQV